MLGMLSAVAGLASGAMNLFGQKKANESNIQQAEIGRDFNAEEAEKARVFNAEQAQIGRDYGQSMFNQSSAFNAAEAQKNRDFQQYNSNTQYQRAVGDLQSAGLNPMLAYTQGGAGTPTGSSASSSAPSAGTASGPGASGPATSRLENIFGPGVQSAAQAADIIATIRNKDATNDLISAQAEAARASAESSRASAGQTLVNTDFARKTFDDRVEIVNSQASSEWEKQAAAKFENSLNSIKAELARGSITLQRAEIEYKRAASQVNFVKRDLLELERPGAENEARWQSSPAGYPARVASGVGGIVGDVVGSAFGLKRMGRLWGGKE